MPDDGDDSPLGLDPRGDPSGPHLIVLPPLVPRQIDESDEPFGALGRPLDHRTPFFIGLSGALGAAVAYLLFRGLADITSVIVVTGLALFVAVGLDPILDVLIEHRLPRGYAVLIVILGFVLGIAGFAVVAVPVISREVVHLLNNYPRYKASLAAGHGWDGRIATKLHLTGYLRAKSTLKIPVSGGILGAGRRLLSFGVAMVSVVALTIYFLVALPGVKKLWLSMIQRSRRERVALITEEVFDRVGGFMLGNLLTSLIAGLTTYLWLLILGVPYALLLALFVAIFDLIPMVGSTIAGIVVSLVAVTKGLPIGIATVAFYVVYRFLEDYLLYPRVMKHTVNVTPGSTIIATLIGGTLLGPIGALIAIPVAATVHLLVEEVAIPRQHLR